MQQDGESSVEEILESIKKVIARDNRVGAAETRRRRTEEGVAELQSEPASEEEAEEILELDEAEIVADDDFADESALEDEFSGPEDAGPAGPPASDAAPLIAENVRASMQENFAALSMLSQPGVQPQIVRSGETSLEGLVRDMMRPMLAEWLDTNLPEMTERIIKAEVARIAGKRD